MAHLKVSTSHFFDHLQRHLRTQRPGVVRLLEHRWAVATIMVTRNAEDFEKPVRTKRVRQPCVGEWIANGTLTSMLSPPDQKLESMKAVWNYMPQEFNLQSEEKSDELVAFLTRLEEEHFGLVDSLEEYVTTNRDSHPLVLPTDAVVGKALFEFLIDCWKELIWNDWERDGDSPELMNMGEVLIFVRAPSECEEFADTVMGQGRKTLRPSEFASEAPVRWAQLVQKYQEMEQFEGFEFKHNTRLVVALQSDGYFGSAQRDDDDDDDEDMRILSAPEGGARSAMDVDNLENAEPVWSGFAQNNEEQQDVLAHFGMTRKQ